MSHMPKKRSSTCKSKWVDQNDRIQAIFARALPKKGASEKESSKWSPVELQKLPQKIHANAVHSGSKLRYAREVPFRPGCADCTARIDEVTALLRTQNLAKEEEEMFVL